MAFKPTRRLTALPWTSKRWRKYGKLYRYIYSGNWGQWRKLQVKKLVDGRFGTSWYRWVDVSQAWEDSGRRPK